MKQKKQSTIFTGLPDILLLAVQLLFETTTEIASSDEGMDFLEVPSKAISVKWTEIQMCHLPYLEDRRRQRTLSRGQIGKTVVILEILTC